MLVTVAVTAPGGRPALLPPAQSREHPRAAGIRNVAITKKYVKKFECSYALATQNVCKVWNCTQTFGNESKMLKKWQKVCRQFCTLTRKCIECAELSPIPLCCKIPSRSGPPVSKGPYYGNLFFPKKVRKPKKQQYFDS